MAMMEELGLKAIMASFAHMDSEVEMLAGDPEAAERELRRHIFVLIEMDDAGHFQPMRECLLSRWTGRAPGGSSGLVRGGSQEGV